MGPLTLAAEAGAAGERYCPACEATFEGIEYCPADGARLVRLSSRDPLVGRDLGGHYTILEKLGQGGMGAVYRAMQHSVGREVAVKVINAHLVSRPEVIKRFLREAKLASRLGHPSAVTVIDFGQTDDGVLYLVMELVAGRTLDEVIEAEGAFAPERVVRIGAQVCDALEVAHGMQIIHRDLKPANIMVLAAGRDRIKVLDFGLAKSVAPDENPTVMTGEGALLGTPAFLPPEVARGEPCDERADLYSLGVMLYLLGTGRLPFEAAVPELISMHGVVPAPPMAGVPPALGRVVDRLLAKRPEERYQTAAEVREALEGALEARGAAASVAPAAVARTVELAAAQAPEEAAGVEPAAVAARPAWSRRWVIAAGIAAAGVGIAMALLVMRSAERREEAPMQQPAGEPSQPAVEQPAVEPAVTPPAVTPPPPELAPPPPELAPPPPETEPPTAPKRTGKPPRGASKQDPPKRPPPKASEPPPKPPASPSAPPPATAGSGSSKSGLPF